MSNFITLHVGLSALRAAQLGMDAAANNVANANTPGYTRERLQLTPLFSRQTAAGPLGSGVDAIEFTRIRNAFLDARYRSTAGAYERATTEADLLHRVEDILAEPDSGLSATLGQLWDSLEDLAANPSQSATRIQVISSLGSIVDRANGIASGWNALSADTRNRESTVVTAANDLLTKIGDLNRQLANWTAPGKPNELMDQRDLLVDQVAELTGATATLQPDGTYTVTIGGEAAVTGITVNPLALNGSALEINGVAVTNGIGGEIRALHDLVEVTLPARFGELETFVTDLSARLNAVHAGGYKPDGTAGGDLLTYTAPTPPARFGTFSVAVSAPAEIAAAGSTPPATHDGDNAKVLAALRTEAQAGGRTFDQQIQDVAITLGLAVRQAERDAKTNGDLNHQAVTARQSAHGVSIDEEMVSLVQFQRALEAASRVMTTIDEALEVITTRLGIVGR